MGISTPASIQLWRAGLSVDISDYVTYSVFEFRGFGMSPLHRLTERGPYQHGASDRGYRLDPRPVYIVVNAYGRSFDDMYDVRRNLMWFLKPGLDPVQIRYLMGTSYLDGSPLTRALDCHVVRGMDGASADKLGYRQRDVIELVANDPTWYDPVATVTEVSLYGGGSGIVIPMVFPTTMAGGSGSASFNVSLTEQNAWDSYPTITAKGPLTALKITNTATGDVIEFTGSIGSPNTWTIDLRYGYKTVKDETGANQIGSLTAASSLATFRFVPGDNPILVTATSTGSTSLVQFSFNKRFIGI